MTDKEIARQGRRIMRYVAKWRFALGLQGWRFDTEYFDGNPPGCDPDATVYANVKVYSQYLTAVFSFNCAELSCMNDARLEETVLHELTHCHLEELEEEGIYHIERVTTQLTNAFLWSEEMGYRNGFKAGKKAAAAGGA